MQNRAGSVTIIRKAQLVLWNIGTVFLVVILGVTFTTKEALTASRTPFETSRRTEQLRLADAGLT
jgi:hypothetical protein